MHNLQQAVVALLAKNPNHDGHGEKTTGTCLNLLCVVIIIEIGLQPMTKMIVTMMSVKKTFMANIVVLLGKMLVIIRNTK